MKITARAIDLTIPGDTDKILWDQELKGFGVKITPKGKRSFFLYYRTDNHTQRRPHIGTYPAMRPEQARSIASNWLLEARSGGDPSADRKRARAMRGTGTVAELLTEYLKSKEELRSVKEIERIFKHDILPMIGTRRAEEVTRTDVTRMLDKIADRSVSLAHAVRRQLSAFYTWAMPRLPASSINPVKDAGKVKAVTKRTRSLKETELKLLWQVLDNEIDPWRPALRILILTGQRREEVLKAEWEEFDFESRVWTIPANRAKNKLVHHVPLSPAVLRVLQGLESRKDWKGRLFPTGIGPTSRAAKRIREAMGADIKPWRWHDLRRTVATGMQRLDVKVEVTEAVLNHISGSKAGIVGVYQQYDYASEKRSALESWALEVERIVS